MRKILTSLFILCFVLAPFLRAEDGLNAMESSAQLVDLQSSRNASKMDDLVRRVAALERDSKFQVDRIRNLERTVDDLKRRR